MEGGEDRALAKRKEWEREGDEEEREEGEEAKEEKEEEKEDAEGGEEGAEKCLRSKCAQSYLGHYENTKEIFLWLHCHVTHTWRG